MLETLVQDPKDIRMNSHRWEWSVRRPWLPIEDILKCGFWSKPICNHIWERLLQPLPSPTITIGGECLTVDILNVEAGPVLHAAGALTWEQYSEIVNVSVRGRRPLPPPGPWGLVGMRRSGSPAALRLQFPGWSRGPSSPRPPTGWSTSFPSRGTAPFLRPCGSG